MSSLALLEDTAQEFWALAGGAPSFPCDLQMAIILTQPLELYPIRTLHVSHVQDWGLRAQSGFSIRGSDRRLHGCLIADKGRGTIFFDEEDSEEEQRFTLAHELAHFLLDYQIPRQDALLALGPSLLPVLNGERIPTREERLHAVLSSVQLGAMSHCMERPEEGLPSSSILDIEDRADRLALELLAPARSLQTLMYQPDAPRRFDARLHFLSGHLFHIHGLPAPIAPTYARSLLTEWGEPTFRDWLLGSAE